MHPPDFILFNSPALSDQLRRRTDELRASIARTNVNSQFARTASELDEFRRLTAGLVDEIDDDVISDIFRKTVRFTTYDSYAPFIARFFEKPCKADAIVDVLSPGFPDFIAHSSSTSGGLAKRFPKYNRLSKMKSSETGPMIVSDPMRGGTTAFLGHYWYDRVEVQDDDNRPIRTIYVGSGSGVDLRVYSNLDPDMDEERMDKFMFDHAAPYAAGFIKNWRSFLLIHAVFALSNRSIENISVAFINTLVEMMRYIDVEFDMVIDNIGNGIVPDLDGVAEVRRYLEPNFSPDPERAAELRSLGRPSSRPAWCTYVWPNLCSVAGIASGSFASVIPLARWYLGANTEIRSQGYGCTEASVIGFPYDRRELNQFRPLDEVLFEFLDISRNKNNDSISALTQPWEVEVGKRYEPVLTTADGLWRYPLGDVIKIAGFDPRDGTPILEFVERRNKIIRFLNFTVTEGELLDVMSSVPQNMLAHVVNWTASIDDRCVPTTIGFFVELVDDQVLLEPGAPGHVLNELSRTNGNIVYSVEHEIFKKPTIRLVRPGTFSEFRQLKIDEINGGLGQIKVPIVLPKASYVAWFSNRVVREL